MTDLEDEIKCGVKKDLCPRSVCLCAAVWSSQMETECRPPAVE